MAHENESPPPEYDGATRQTSWGARNSLRKSLKKDVPIVDGEASPLLGSGSTDDDEQDDNERRDEVEPEWEGMVDFQSLPWWRRPSIFWLVPSFFLYALAFGGIIVPKINLILQLICWEYYMELSKSDPTINPPLLFQGGDGDGQCRHNPDIQAIVTKFTLLLTIIIGSLSAVMSPKIGALSDRNGRVKLLVITSLGGFMTEVITILAYKYPEAVHYKWLLAGAVFEGFCGSFTAGFAVTHAYAADCTPPAKRSVAFGYFHACLFSGIALGPMAVATILEYGGTLIIVFYIALGIHTFFMLFVLFVVPESLSKKRQIQAQDKYKAENANIITDGYTWIWALKTVNILSPLRILWPTGPGTSSRLRANLILLSIVDTTIFGVAMGALNVLVLYTGYVFDWKTADTSLFVSEVNVIRVLGLLVILPLLNYLVRRRRQYTQRRDSGFVSAEPSSGSDLFDLSIIRGAIFLEVFGYFGYATATTPQMFVASGVLAALGGIGSPTLQASLTKHVPQNQIGQLLGATGLLHALARIIAPTIFGLIYAKTVATVPSTVFIVLTAFFVVAFFFSWFIRPHVYIGEQNVAISIAERPNPVYDPDVLVDEEITGS